MKRYRIAEWEFDPASGELRSGAECRRLEPRAARTLELLCDAGGEVVPQERLIAEVWGGRSLSDNSVSVVISQLRRSLGDDARQPAVIETVPKRGYRLARKGSSSTEPARPAGRRQGLLAIAAALALVVVAALAWTSGSRGTTIAVSDVVNATGDPRFDPLARATSELIVTQLARREFAVRRDRSEADLRFSSRLVLWNGRPSLGMTATGADGVVRWSGMTNGTAEQLPMGVIAELDELRRQIPAQ